MINIQDAIDAINSELVFLDIVTPNQKKNLER